jgi:hypothetical protein
MPTIHKSKKDDGDVHIHFDVNVVVNEEGKSPADPRIMVDDLFFIFVLNLKQIQGGPKKFMM